MFLKKLFLIAISVTMSLSSFAAKPAEQMNVLFISADDLNCDISPYGVKQVKTPNLDRLAKMGTLFDRAYCQQPLCGPSRASVMSGLRPNTIGAYTLDSDLRRLKPDLVTLGEFFKNKGYYSGRVGKIFHMGNPGAIGTNGNDDEQTWTERFNPAGIDSLQEKKILRYPGAYTGREGGLGISLAWWAPESKDEEHTDGMVAKRAIDMIKAHKDEPFFIAAGFFNPHCPYVAPKKYFDMYDINDITMPDLDEAREDLKDVPRLAVHRDMERWPFYLNDISIDEAKQCKLAYYASISFVDAQIGRILDTLEENNLMDKTIIVFWSDHGYFLGEKGLWFKSKAFERAVRVPLIITVPGTPKGQVSTKPVELLDLYPTLVDYAGFEVPKGLEGFTLRPLIADPKSTKWDHPAITQVHYRVAKQGYSIRTEKWRYTEWNEGEDGKELYNHEIDPGEVTNLAKNPEYAQVMADLSKPLQLYSKTYLPEPPKVKRKHKNKNKKK